VDHGRLIKFLCARLEHPSTESLSILGPWIQDPRSDRWPHRKLIRTTRHRIKGPDLTTKEVRATANLRHPFLDQRSRSFFSPRCLPRRTEHTVWWRCRRSDAQTPPKWLLTYRELKHKEEKRRTWCGHHTSGGHGGEAGHMKMWVRSGDDTPATNLWCTSRFPLRLTSPTVSVWPGHPQAATRELGLDRNEYPRRRSACSTSLLALSVHARFSEEDKG
jgi:hypothetical protein